MIWETLRVLWVLLCTFVAIYMALSGDPLVPVFVVALLVSELVSIQQEKTIKMYRDALDCVEKMVKELV